jgi:hypothetical protein
MAVEMLGVTDSYSSIASSSLGVSCHSEICVLFSLFFVPFGRFLSRVSSITLSADGVVPRGACDQAVDRDCHCLGRHCHVVQSSCGRPRPGSAYLLWLIRHRANSALGDTHRLAEEFDDCVMLSDACCDDGNVETCRRSMIAGRLKVLQVD